MNLLLVSITFALYFPIFILPVLGYTGIYIYNPLLYSALILLALISIDYASSVISDSQAFNLRTMPPIHKQLLFFDAYMILMIYFKGAIENCYKTAYQVSLSIVVSAFVLVYAYTRGYGHRFTAVFDKLSIIFGICLSIQTLLSIYESVTGAYFASPFWSLGTSIAHRDILQIFGMSQFRLFGFRLGLNGLLFQANIFASMLVFYNIVFLLRYFESRKRIFLFFLSLALFTAIGNTTRFAIFTILISDLIVFFKIYRDIKVKFFAVSGIIILAILYLNQLLMRWNVFFEKTNTIQSRLYLWRYFWDVKIPATSVVEKLFGTSLKDYLAFGADYGKVSFENAYFQQFVLSGLIGLALYFVVLHVSPLWLNRKSSGLRKLGNSLIVICVILISIFSGIFHFSTFIILTVLILRLGCDET